MARIFYINEPGSADAERGYQEHLLLPADQHIICLHRGGVPALTKATKSRFIDLPDEPERVKKKLAFPLFDAVRGNAAVRFYGKQRNQFFENEGIYEEEPLNEFLLTFSRFLLFSEPGIHIRGTRTIAPDRIVDFLPEKCTERLVTPEGLGALRRLRPKNCPSFSTVNPGIDPSTTEEALQLDPYGVLENIYILFRCHSVVVHYTPAILNTGWMYYLMVAAMIGLPIIVVSSVNYLPDELNLLTSVVTTDLAVGLMVMAPALATQSLIDQARMLCSDDNTTPQEDEW